VNSELAQRIEQACLTVTTRLVHGDSHMWTSGENFSGEARQHRTRAYLDEHASASSVHRVDELREPYRRGQVIREKRRDVIGVGRIRRCAGVRENQNARRRQSRRAEMRRQACLGRRHEGRMECARNG
jgi:hypothetical protein